MQPSVKAAFLNRFVVACIVLCALAGCAQKKRSWLPRAETAQIRSTNAAPFELDGDRIVVSGRINGNEARLVLDTGATALAMSERASARLGLTAEREIQARGFGGAGTGAIKLSTAQSIDLGTIVSSNVPAAIVPLPPFFEWDGLLGLSVLANFVCAINFDDQRIAFHPAGQATMQPIATLRLRIADGALAIEAEVNGAKGWFVLDSGSGDDLVLNPAFLKRADMRRNLGPTIPVLTGIGLFGESQGEVTRIDTFKVGPWTFRNTFTELSAVGLGEDDGMAGVIGMGTLIRFNLLLDIPAQQLGLSPSKKYFDIGHVSAFERTGMMIYPTPEMRYYVRNLLENSPAARAGFKVGDELLKIDGTSVAEMRPNAVREAFRKDKGTVVRVRVQADSEARNLTIELGEAF